MARYELEKSVWTHNDFDIMGWHDVNIHAFGIAQDEEYGTADLMLDIDYIFQWIEGPPPSRYFSFWISPCTLIFKNAFDIKIDISLAYGGFMDCEIADMKLINKMEQEGGNLVYEWKLELREGTISLKSYGGFEQIVKRYPIHKSIQALELVERGGINFDTTPYDA